MFFFFFSNSSLSLTVILLTLVKLLFLEVSVVPRYVSPTFHLMPVTTRSQYKRLQQVSGDHSFTITPGHSYLCQRPQPHKYVILVHYRHQRCQCVIIVHQHCPILRFQLLYHANPDYLYLHPHHW
jgi:hypothetical protein